MSTTGKLKVHKSIKKTLKSYFSARKKDDTKEEPPLQDQVEFIKKKINEIKSELKTLIDQKMKTFIQINQLKSSSDYLLNNLFKELVENTSIQKVMKKPGKNSKNNLLKGMSNN